MAALSTNWLCDCSLCGLGVFIFCLSDALSAHFSLNQIYSLSFVVVTVLCVKNELTWLTFERRGRLFLQTTHCVMRCAHFKPVNKRNKQKFYLGFAFHSVSNFWGETMWKCLAVLAPHNVPAVHLAVLEKTNSFPNRLRM